MLHSIPGPDELVPSDKVITWVRDEAVKLRLGDSGYPGEKPISLPTMFKETVKKSPDAIALGE